MNRSNGTLERSEIEGARCVKTAVQVTEIENIGAYVVILEGPYLVKGWLVLTRAGFDSVCFVCRQSADFWLSRD